MVHTTLLFPIPDILRRKRVPDRGVNGAAWEEDWATLHHTGTAQ